MFEMLYYASISPECSLSLREVVRLNESGCRPLHEDVMSTGSRNLQRSLNMFLTAEFNKTVPDTGLLS
jgi:hypothetical protein